MFRFCADCIETWLKCFIGEILVLLILGVLVVVGSGIFAGIVFALKYLGN